MIDITAGDPIVSNTRNRMRKQFDIDVTIKEQSHNLDIKIFYEEDLDGDSPELDRIEIENNRIFFGENDTEDVGSRLHEALAEWFDTRYEEFSGGETEEEFDAIFSAVWEYLEEKGLA
jgi:hypothetical protein